VCFDFGKGLLDRVQIRTIGRQEQEPGASLLQTFRRSHTLVDREVVEDDHITFRQCGRQLRLDVDVKRQAGNRAIDDPWRAQFVATQPGEEGVGLPMPEGSAHAETLALTRTAAQADHLGVDVCLVEKHQPMRLLTHAILTLTGLDPALIPHGGACALRRQQVLFYR
jgi:hypothetical protein